ncbi:MAG: RNA polymerase sporulation sigma factor SigK [Clostridia bacterium]|nr:RNA polymerase sporulation sigma factor SigK [Clostridia bacterium]
MFIEFIQFILSKCLFFCSSIMGESFPKPLTKKEESELLLRFKAGDTAAKDKLISHNLRLVAHIVKKYQGADDSDDLISVGTIGLIKAINSFQPEKGTQLATYTARCIENEILMLLRANKKRQQDVSISDVVGTDKDGNKLTIMDLLADGDESIIDKVEKRATSKALLGYLKRTLTGREFKIIVLRYGLKNGVPLPQREVANLLKISRSYVSRIEKKVICSLKNSPAFLNYFNS